MSEENHVEGFRWVMSAANRAWSVPGQVVLGPFHIYEYPVYQMGLASFCGETPIFSSKTLICKGNSST